MNKLYFGFVRVLAKIIFPRRKMVWQEGVETSSEPAIFVSNHSGIAGPVAVELYFKLPKRIWLTSAMVNKENGVNYFFHDMMLGRSAKNKKKTRRSAKLVMNLISPLLINNDRFLLVNKATMSLKDTFANSLATLDSGKNLVIFPEKHLRYGKYINTFHRGFVDIARLYAKRTGKALKIYPMYIGGDTHSINIGEPIVYDVANDRHSEADRVCEYLQGAIEQLGASLPPHKVIPYVPDAFYEYYAEYEDDEVGFYNFVNQPYTE